LIGLVGGGVVVVVVEGEADEGSGVCVLLGSDGGVTVVVDDEPGELLADSAPELDDTARGDAASSVPSIKPSPFLSSTWNSWPAGAALPFPPNASMNSCWVMRPSPFLSMRPNSPDCAVGEEAGGVGAC
jgi:hypothetical protein